MRYLFLSILTLLLRALSPVRASLETLRVVGPFGKAWSNRGYAEFDDRELAPLENYSTFHIDCRWGDRLDYIRMSWFNKPGAPLSTMQHGNPDGGSKCEWKMLATSDDILTMTAHTCTGSRNLGKVCGIYFTFKSSDPFACGVMNPYGAEPTYRFENGHKFWALLGGTENNGKTLLKIGWTASELQ